MKFNHVVNLNGKYYTAGEEVPVKTDIEKRGEPQGLPFSESEIEVKEPTDKYTYDDLDGMTVRELKRKAEELGISITKNIKSDMIDEFLEKQG